ncbi:hypothetical protein [Serratia quinivorans]
MFAETAAVLSATKQTFDLLKIIQEGRDAALVKNAIGELSQKITELQMLNIEIVGLYHAEKKLTMQLSEEKTKKEIFIQNSANYTVHKTETGTTVYRSKEGFGETNESHDLCTYCYQNEKISILQPSPKITTIFNQTYINAFCPGCSSEFVMHKSPSHTTGRMSFDEFRLG